ncbi:MAG: hypothetical protein ACLTXW_07675 [Christensenellales bacterium]
MNAMNQDNDPMEQEEPMLPEDDAFLLDFPLRQAVPGEPEQPAFRAAAEQQCRPFGL